MEKLVLIDGHSILFRAFYGVPPLSNSSGEHTNAVYGFLNILFKILDEENANYLAIAFDLSFPTFRHRKYPDYKGTRKPMPEELRTQVPLMREVLQTMHIPTLSLEGYEADDVIGTVAKRFQKEGLQISIVSGDRDLLQLADERIRIRIPKTARGQTQIYNYDPETVKETYLVTPKEFIDVKALMGDVSDNIPGVPSIGEKTATAIISQFHSIENAYANIDHVKPPRAQKALLEHYEKAEFSKWLATIVTDAPVKVDLKEMEIGNLYTQEAYEKMKQLEFRSLLKRFERVEKKDSKRKMPEISIISDKAEAQKKIAAWKRKKTVGMQSNESGIMLCESEETVYVLPRDLGFASSLIRELFDAVPEIFVMDLKSILHQIGTRERKNIRDLGIAAYLLNPLKESYRAEDIARDYLDDPIPAEEKDLLQAGCWDAFVAFHAGKHLMDALSERGMKKLYEEVELPLTYALAEMECVGIRVDGTRLHNFSIELTDEIQKVEQEIFLDTGESFNINSPKQLGEILFEKMKLPHAKKTKNGYSTAADILEKLSPDYPVVRKILRYRMLTKLNSTYAAGLSAYIEDDGRIHGTFNQTVTATGRISSTEPNLQNIPIRTEMGSRIRSVFVPDKGKVFVDADYSQIELRVLASLSEDETLIEAYRHAVDIHAVTASQVFGVPLSEVTPLLRNNAKAVNFGVVYGISAFGLSEGLSISRADAKEYINNYFKTYPKVKKFLDGKIREAREKGYTTTLFGRIRPVPELKSSHFMQRAFGERVAMNAPIQGTAADIMKIATVNVQRALLKEQSSAKIVLQIHDELLIECDEKDASHIETLVSETMRAAAKLAVTLEVSVHRGKSWLEAH